MESSVTRPVLRPSTILRSPTSPGRGQISNIPNIFWLISLTYHHAARVARYEYGEGEDWVYAVKLIYKNLQQEIK